MNRVVLVGRLTKDPELKVTPNGIAVAAFTLAVNRSFTNAQGEKEADFINCVVWRRPAENVANFLKKGSLAGVDGRVQTRSYENQDGKRVYVTEVLAESVQFLEPKKEGTNDEYADQARREADKIGQQNQNQQRDQPYSQHDPFAGGTQIDISDDDLPF
ncbi:single-stranded DNA-binding protein [Mesobacillus stamsii]